MEFPCLRCKRKKVSKLISIVEENWSYILCNACYGFLLSQYDVKGGAGNECEQANQLAAALQALMDSDNRHDKTNTT